MDIQHQNPSDSNSKFDVGLQKASIGASPSGGAVPILISYVKRITTLFWIIVLIPTLISVVYFGFVASDVYVSESQFVVRSPKNQSAATGLGALLQSAGFARSSDDTYTIHAYMRSRDALNELNRDKAVSNHYGSDKVDIVSRFNSMGFSGSVEDLFLYFQKKIALDVEVASSISTLKIRAYDAQQAKAFNEQLLKLGEDLINQLNSRGRRDLIGYAEAELKQSEQRVADSAAALNQYRVGNGIFDVKEQAQIQGQLVSKLQDELVSVKTQLSQVEAVTPDNPQISALRARETSVRKEIANEMAKILGGGSSIANKTAEFERLNMEYKLAEQQLEASMLALNNANAEAQKKQLYLEVIAQPNAPDVPAEPQRIYNILTTFILSLMAFAVFKLIVSGVREHQG